jgi:hypothetical protein
MHIRSYLGLKDGNKQKGESTRKKVKEKNQEQMQDKTQIGLNKYGEI